MPATPLICRSLPLLALAVSLASARAESFELLALEKGKPTDAQISPVITALDGWELQQGPTPSLVLPVENFEGSDTQSAQFTITLPPELRERPFTITFTSEITGSGWTSVSLRGGGPAPQPMLSVGRSPRGHANIQSSDGQRMELSQLMQEVPIQIAVTANPAERTIQVSMDERAPTIVPYPTDLNEVTTISFSLTAKDSLATSASISNPVLTFQE